VLLAHSEHHWAEAWLALRHHVLDLYDLTTSGRRIRTLRIAAKVAKLLRGREQENGYVSGFMFFFL
jgi:hypothetical protein